MWIRTLLQPTYLLMGPHVASERVRRAIRGHRRHSGSAEAILRAGLEDCWSGRYLTASPATYRHFWTRDTGFAARSLVRLGDPWPARLLSSLAWAIDVWRRRRSHVTTTIDPGPRRPVDIFDYGVDSLPLLLWSLRSLADAENPRVAEGAAALAHEHRAWIAAEVEHFAERVVDPTTGLVRSDRTFSAHRDTFRNSSTAYANTMVALLARTVAETGWGPELLSKHFIFANLGSPAHSPAVMPVGVIRRGAGAGTAGGRDARSAQDRESEGSRIPATPTPTAPTSAPRTPPTRTPPTRMTPTRITAGDDDGRADFAHTSPGEADAAGADAGVADAGGADQGGAAHAAAAAGPTGDPDWGGLLRRHFWLGDRFRDRLGSGATADATAAAARATADDTSDETSGEANVWPFFVGLVDDREMLAAALATLDREGYATPYPLRFSLRHDTERLLLAYRLWSPDYQTTTTWTSLGSIYLALLREVDPAGAAVGLDRMRRLIKRDGTFWEVLDDRGRPWRSRLGFSVSDQSMLWGAILLETLLADTLVS